MRHPVPCIIKCCDSLLSHRISLDRLPSKPNSLSLSSFVGLATEPKKHLMNWKECILNQHFYTHFIVQ